MGDHSPYADRAPGTGQLVGTLRYATAVHVEEAIQGAVRAFEITRRMGAFERQRILRSISHGMEGQREDLAQLLAMEAGKPLKAAANRGDYAVQFSGEPGGAQAGTSHCGRLPNCAETRAADAVIFLGLGEIIEAAGWPPGALSVLPLSNEDAGRIVTEDRLKLLSFTGSTAVGWALKQKAGKKKVVLELGGNGAVVVGYDMEVFGPVVTVEKVCDFSEALTMLNRSDFGLQAGLFTRDFARITKPFETLEIGGLMAGEVPSWRIDHMPYGGVKDSGIGREGVRHAMEEMTEPRLLAIHPQGIRDAAQNR